jgi:hypothetical protein
MSAYIAASFSTIFAVSFIINIAILNDELFPRKDSKQEKILGSYSYSSWVYLPISRGLLCGATSMSKYKHAAGPVNPV